MKVKFLLKDGRAMESRTDTYGREHIEKMLIAIENDFEMRVEENIYVKVTK
ncbi:hypothetical protein [Paenibacillus silvae]|uniref:hypothetical protein n=1 Tax=Paenibacillus silvae TaxID=1325358 RepID=UPI00142DE265|nr:hypothetical protein [Paenibacillus silvae]